MHEILNHLTDLILSNWIFPNRCSLLIRLRIHLCGGQTRGSAVVTCEISLLWWVAWTMLLQVPLLQEAAAL